MTNSELAVVYATLILHAANSEISAENINKILTAAKVTVEPYWPSLFAGLAKKQNVGDLISGVGSAPAAAAAAAPAAGEAVEEEKDLEEGSESDDESSGGDLFGGGLFGGDEDSD